MNVNNNGGVGGVGGASGGPRPGGDITPEQSQQIQEKTGMSEKEVNKLVDSMAQSSDMTHQNAAQLVLDSLNAQKTSGAEGSAPASDVGEADKNENGIPDFIEKLVESGALPLEKAGEMLQGIGIEDDKIQAFMEKVGGEGAGTGGGDGASSKAEFSF